MSGHFFGVTTHGYDRPIGDLICPRILSEYKHRNVKPNKWTACDLGRTSDVFPDRELRQYDSMYGSNDGYSYGSFERVRSLKKRYMPPPETPKDTYRLPPLTNMQYSWFRGDPGLAAGYDETATRNQYGQCEVEERNYPQPAVAGLTTRDINRVYHLQVRGRVEKQTATEQHVLPVGASVSDTPQLSLRLEDPHPEKTVWKTVAGPEHEQAADLDGCATIDECPKFEATKTDPEFCAKKLGSHVWYKHRKRYPQFYSAMTRFVETVRINDKLFEQY